jgi:hypothetical protein
MVMALFLLSHEKIDQIKERTVTLGLGLSWWRQP